MIISYFTKLLVIRFGGAETYGSKVVPVSTGILCGSGIIQIMVNLAITLRGMGIAHLDGYGKGDQHIQVTVKVPTKLNKRQKDGYQRVFAARTQLIMLNPRVWSNQ
jgi:arginine exporter protein ArgO